MSDAEVRSNNFGLLRLAFASLVVLSHAPELIDGNRSRELLTRLFGTLSFGEVGVDGFFLISGYLITKSFLTSPGLLAYLGKRMARIYPAFLVATVVSILFFAPLSGTSLGVLGVLDWLHAVKYAVLLQPPPVPAFPGTHYAILNGAMWTIAYEFRCYLLVAALGLTGILQRREFILVGTVIAILFMAARPAIPFDPSNVYFGNVTESIRMTGTFLVGALFYLYRDVIVYRTAPAMFALIVVCACLFVKGVAEPAFCIFGGYLIFWLALRAPKSALGRLSNRHDISYGLYLYTWPIQSALVYFNRDMSPWLMFAISLALAALCGLASWTLIESRIQRWVHRRNDTDVVVPVAAEARLA